MCISIYQSYATVLSADATVRLWGLPPSCSGGVTLIAMQQVRYIFLYVNMHIYVCICISIEQNVTPTLLCSYGGSG